jgi:hypothetical protein
LISASWVARITGVSHRCLGFCNSSRSQVSKDYLVTIEIYGFISLNDFFIILILWLIILTYFQRKTTHFWNKLRLGTSVYERIKFVNILSRIFISMFISKKAWNILIMCFPCFAFKVMQK